MIDRLRLKVRCGHCRLGAPVVGMLSILTLLYLSVRRAPGCTGVLNMSTWYTQDRWKAYISWFSPQWAMLRDEFDAGEWVDKLERGGFRVVVMHVKHHDGVCFYPSKYRDDPPCYPPQHSALFCASSRHLSCAPA